MEEKIRQKVIGFFLKKEFLNEDEALNMLSWKESGFSLDAGVCIESEDRDGLERLLRYCARPIFASSKLEITGERIKYTLAKPKARGEKILLLKPFELLDRLAKLIPPPRFHRHMYHGVLAPHSPLRAKIVQFAGREMTLTSAQMEKIILDRLNPEESNLPGSNSIGILIEEEKPRKVSFGWAKLIARIYEVLPLVCPKCGETMKIIAFIEDRLTIEKILNCLNEPIDPPPIASARGPPEPEFNYDQRYEYD